MSRAMSYFMICTAAVAVIPACVTAVEPDEVTLDDSTAEVSLALSSEGEVCVTSGALQDAVLRVYDPDRDRNEGDSEELTVGSHHEGDYRFSVIQFDTSGVPSGATVMSASMTLYVTYTEAFNPIEAHRITAPWSESTVTMNSLGDDYDSEAAASFTVEGLGALEVPITDLAKAWIDDGNHGLLLDTLLHNFAYGAAFASRESPNVDERPSLSICYVTCDDGIQNGNETGVDCGGSCAACPTCDDGVQNGGETGVDCGGSCAACVQPPVCGNGVKEAGEQCDGADVGLHCVLGVVLCTPSCHLLLNLCIGPH